MKSSILQECIRIAQKHNTPESHPEWGKFHHFSFIVQDNKIVEWATNKAHTPLTRFGYPAGSKLHAETEAYRKAKGLLNPRKSWECVNVRLLRDNTPRLSAPCSCCYNFLDILGCKKVYFTTDIISSKNNSVVYAEIAF